MLQAPVSGEIELLSVLEFDEIGKPAACLRLLRKCWKLEAVPELEAIGTADGVAWATPSGVEVFCVARSTTCCVNCGRRRLIGTTGIEIGVACGSIRGPSFPPVLERPARPVL